MSVAATYLSSFRETRPMLEGFELALSKEGFDLLSSIPEKNAKISQPLVDRALAEIGANSRAKLQYKLQQELNKQERRMAAFRMAGSLFNLSSQMGLPSVDPLEMQFRVNSYLSTNDQRRSSKFNAASEFTARASEQLGRSG